MSNGTARGERAAAARSATAPRRGPGRSLRPASPSGSAKFEHPTPFARGGPFPGPGPTRGYIIARVSLRLLLIKPLTAAAPERPSAVSFLRGLAAKSAFLLAATVGLNLLVDPLGVHGSRLFDPIALKTRGTKLYLYEQTRPAPAIVVLGSSRSFGVEPRYITAKTSRSAFNAAVGG